MNRGSAIINFENAIMKHEGASSASSNKNLVDLKVSAVPSPVKYENVTVFYLLLLGRKMATID